MNKIRTTTLLAALLLVCGLFTGCKQMDAKLFTQTAWQTSQVPAQVVSVVTNQPVVKAATNVVSGAVTTETNVVPVNINITIPAHTEVIPTAWKPNEQTTSLVSTVSGLAGPYGGLISTGFAAILGIAAALRGKKYKDAGVSLAQGIQDVMEKFPDQKAAALEVHKDLQRYDGTQDTVDKLLEQVVKKA